MAARFLAFRLAISRSLFHFLNGVLLWGLRYEQRPHKILFGLRQTG